MNKKTSIINQVTIESPVSRDATKNIYLCVAADPEDYSRAFQALADDCGVRIDEYTENLYEHLRCELASALGLNEATDDEKIKRAAWDIADRFGMEYYNRKLAQRKPR